MAHGLQVGHEGLPGKQQAGHTLVLSSALMDGEEEIQVCGLYFVLVHE